MANSKLLKEAIADAKAVKETALANAKLALEEAFTPRLQSILSKKMKAEAEMTDDEDQDQMRNEELDSSEIGSSDMREPDGFDAHTEFEGGSTETESGETGSELDDYSKVKDLTEEEDMDDDDMDMDDDSDDDMYSEEEFGSEDDDMESDDMDFGDDMGSEEDSDEEDMDLESIIRELEAQLDDEQPGDEEENMDDMEESLSNGEEAGTDKGEDPKVVVSEEEEEKEDDLDEVIDLEEILREMEADMQDDEEKPVAKEEMEKKEKELEEAYKTIKSLQSTINEVNLLNAKLLFANKLFRAYNMTNEQKVKVIETLDRTKSVREVKLVYSTLAENFKYTSTSSKVVKKAITEGIASKPVKSTKPAAAAKVITESADFSHRFKTLAGIIK